MNRVKSLLSRRGMLLGYSFKARPSSRLLDTSASVMAFGLSINGCSYSENQYYEREEGQLVLKFELRRLNSLDAILKDPPFLLLICKAAIP